MEEPPKWRGINLQTAENVKFAATSQLFKTYLTCLNFPVSPVSVLNGWLMGSYQGAVSEQTGMPEGEGSASLVDGLTYTGSFKGGLLHGQGTLAKPDGWSYTGTFSYNCIHGSGTYTWSNQALYKGEVYQGLPHGEGVMYTGEEDDCTYEGSWKHGFRHGQGTLTYGKSGTTKYEGRWFADRKHGLGYQTYDSGTTFTGSWSQSKRNGKGRLVSVSTTKPSTCLYGGELGRVNLVGIYVYDGDWVDDLSSGSGKSAWMTAVEEEASNKLLNCYVGEFERGLRHGRGTFYYASGAIYKGEWKDNKKHGDGCFINHDGSILYGKFISDRHDGSPVVLEPLQSLFKDDVSFGLVKDKLSNVLLRHNSTLRNIFSKYSGMSKGEATKRKLESKSHSLNLEQFWRLCYDGKILQPGLGLAQIDWLLRPTEASFDNSYELHKPSRQFIFREFIEVLFNISKIKFPEEETSLDEKVDKMITNHLTPMLSINFESCSTVLQEVEDMKSVLDGYSSQIQELFTKTVRGIGTSDDTINLRSLDLFFQRYKPQWGLQRDRLLESVIKGLYCYDIRIGDDGNKLLDNDINFIEFQIAIFIYASNILKDPDGMTLEPVIMLNTFIKDTIVPNLTTDLDSLMNEDLMPNLPSINLKSAKSAPGSKISTPRQGKSTGAKSAPQTPQAAKSAPQTPQKKKQKG